MAIPRLEGLFGICWEEWAAHLAGLTADFHEAERLLRLAEGSLKLPPGWSKTEMCNALERPGKLFDSTEGIIRFSAEPLEILTIAFVKG